MGSTTQNRGSTQCTGKAGLTAGTTSTYTTTAAAEGFIRGEFATALAAQTNTATPTTDWNGDAFTSVADDEGCVFVYCIIAAGTIAVVQGDIESLDADTGDFLITPQFPDIDNTLLPFGFMVMANTSGSAFEFGTTSFAGAGVGDTYTDVGVLPDRPQEA